MNEKETAAVLAYMVVAWPSATIAPNTSKVWAEHLAQIHPKDGLAAAQNLVRSEEFFPSIAKFIESSRAARRIRVGNPDGQDRAEAFAELDPPVSERTRAEQKAYIHEWLTEFKKRTSLDDPRLVWGKRQKVAIDATSAPDDGWINDAKTVLHEVEEPF